VANVNIKKSLVLIALVTASFAVNLDTTIVNVALPALVRQLHATTSQLQWVVDAYNLVFAALILTFGSLSDRLGRKGMLLAGLGVFGTFAVLGGFASGNGQLIAARAFMGLGAAMVFPSTLSLISNVFTERKERAAAIGIWGASAGAAIALGPIVGGWLLEQSSWPAVFYAMAPVAAAAAIMVAAWVPTSRDPSAPAVDWGGFATSTATMALLVYTLIEAPEWGWLTPATLGGFALAILCGGAFLAWELHTRSPMLDVRLFTNMRFSAASASVTVAFFTLFGFIFLMTQYFQFLQSYSPLVTGVRLLPVAVSVGASSVIGTRLAVRFGTKLVVCTGLLFITGFYAWVAATITPTLGYGTIAVQMVLYGVGLGLTSAPATESILGAVSNEQAGIGSAVNDATRLLGGTLGVAVIGSIYASLYQGRLRSTLPSALPVSAHHTAQQSVGAAYSVAEQAQDLGHAIVGSAVREAANGAFVHGTAVACVVAGVVAGAGALFAARYLPAQPLDVAAAESSPRVVVSVATA
jgi:EmrB/QacA subfamily drug resistance transporter